MKYLLDALKSANIQSFMKMIRLCEGTSSEDGYNYMFGSSPSNKRRFTDMTHHPNQRYAFGQKSFSDAAGAYQIMYATEQGLIAQLIHLGMTSAEATMFDAPTQDLKCVLLFSNHNCCKKIIDGHFEDAIQVLNKTWASLPGSPYGQPTHDITEVTNWYKQNGGTFAV